MRLRDGVERVARAIDAGDADEACAGIDEWFGEACFDEEALGLCIKAISNGGVAAEPILRKLLSLRKFGSSINREYDGDLFLYAAKSGSGSLIRVLADEGLNPNSLASNGEYPLSIAARMGGEEEMAAFLDRGAKLNGIFGRGCVPPLMAALKWSNLKNAAYLVDRGASLSLVDDLNSTPLIWLSAMHVSDVSKDEYLSLMKKMLRKGVKADHENSFEQSAMRLAAAYGCAESVGLLVQAGISPNADRKMSLISLKKRSPLSSAANAGNAETFAALIKAGANAESDGEKLACMAAGSSSDGGIGVLSEIERLGFEDWFHPQKKVFGESTMSALEAAATTGTVAAVEYLTKKTPEYAQKAFDAMPKKAERIGHAALLLSSGATLNDESLKTADAEFVEFARSWNFRSDLKNGLGANGMNRKGAVPKI